MKQGRIIILSGPSGSGKTTLHEKLLKDPRFKNKIVKSLSATTRTPRQGERDGRDYLFLDKKEFVAMQKKDKFLESMKVFDNYYGTPRQKVEENLKKGKSVLLCIDVKGAREVSRQCPEALKIFVRTANVAQLKKRLKGRGTESKESFALRLKIAKEELKEAKHYNYVLINDSLHHASRNLAQIVAREIAVKPKSAKG